MKKSPTLLAAKLKQYEENYPKGEEKNIIALAVMDMFQELSGASNKPYTDCDIVFCGILMMTAVEKSNRITSGSIQEWVPRITPHLKLNYSGIYMSLNRLVEYGLIKKLDKHFYAIDNFLLPTIEVLQEIFSNKGE